MLVDNSIYRNAYVANGSSKSFAISFPFLTAEHIQVFRGVDNENDMLIPASEYTISGTGNENGGTLVMNTTPASGTRIVILRNVPITQLYAYEELDNFSAKSHEDALAKLTMIDQQQQEQIDRSIKIPVTDSRTPEQYAQELIEGKHEAQRWAEYAEAQADRTVQIPSTTEVLATGSTTPRPLTDRFADVVNVKDFGAKGDGVTDDTAAIRAAITSADGRTVFFPLGAYCVNPISPIVLNNVTIKGEGHYEYGAPYNNNSSCFLIYGDETPFVVGRGVTITGCSFYWPEQDGVEIKEFKPLFTGTYITQFLFEHCTVVNAYDFLYIPPDGIIGDSYFHHNRCFAVNTVFNFEGGAPESIFISDSIFSFGMYEDVVQFEPFTLRQYYTSNGVFLRCNIPGWAKHTSIDGLGLHDNLIFGCRYAIKLDAGMLHVGNISDNKFDAVGTVIGVYGAAKYTSMTFVGNLVYSYKLGDDTANATVMEFYGTGDTSSGLFVGNCFAYAQGSVFTVGPDVHDDLVITANKIYAFGNTAASGAYSAITLADADCIVKLSDNIIRSITQQDSVGVLLRGAIRVDVVNNTFSNCTYDILIERDTPMLLTNNTSIGTSGRSIRYADQSFLRSIRAYNNEWAIPEDTNIAFWAVPALEGELLTSNQKVILGTAIYNQGGCFNTDASEFIAPLTGWYRFEVGLCNSAGSVVNDMWALTIGTNSDSTPAKAIAVVTSSAAGSAAFNVTRDLYLSKGDVVSVHLVRAAGTGSYDVLRDGSICYFTGRLL